MPVPAIIAIGGSAGAVELVARLAGALPAGLPAAVFVCIHFPESAVSVLPRLIGRAGSLPAAHAVDGEPIEAGRIYVARPGCHLLVGRERVRLTKGPKENGHRPAVDPLFRSAARAHGPRAVGVVLSGNLDDGSAGLSAIVRAGGTAIVQDPDDALYQGMPRSAVEHVAVHHVAPLAGLAELIIMHAGRIAELPEEAAVSPDESDPAEVEDREMRAPREDAPPSPYTCPECSGTLFDVTESGEPLRFRCRVGHAYTAEYLLADQAEALEAGLWSALRALEEHAALARRMAERAGDRGSRHSASRFTEQAVDAEHHASVVRTALERMRAPIEGVVEAVAAYRGAVAEGAAPATPGEGST
jgi:two-component system chemotaxis response regulator CheB